jgi:hypothetical protein
MKIFWRILSQLFSLFSSSKVSYEQVHEKPKSQAETDEEADPDQPENRNSPVKVQRLLSFAGAEENPLQNLVIIFLNNKTTL